jgi:hypothetical protein
MLLEYRVVAPGLPAGVMLCLKPSPAFQPQRPVCTLSRTREHARLALAAGVKPVCSPLRQRISSVLWTFGTLPGTLDLRVFSVVSIISRTLRRLQAPSLAQKGHRDRSAQQEVGQEERNSNNLPAMLSDRSALPVVSATLHRLQRSCGIGLWLYALDHRETSTPHSGFVLPITCWSVGLPRPLRAITYFIRSAPGMPTQPRPSGPHA